MKGVASKVAFGLILVIVGISLFLIFVGYPGSGETTTMSCSIGNTCTSSSQFTSTYTPTLLGVIPLVFGILGGIGLVIGRLVFAWAANVLLLTFAFFGIFSIGFYYFPISIILLVLLAFAQNREL